MSNYFIDHCEEIERAIDKICGDLEKQLIKEATNKTEMKKYIQQIKKRKQIKLVNKIIKNKQERVFKKV